jgi:hypothetical protein
MPTLEDRYNSYCHFAEQMGWYVKTFDEWLDS